MKILQVIEFFMTLALCPLLPGVINKVKALFAGRRGPPVLQLYYDLWRLLNKDSVYSDATTAVFKAAPMISLCALVTAAVLAPWGGTGSAVSFSGDLFVFAGLMVLCGFATAVSALDTGSSFEGMGASREVQFAALAEPALLLSLAALVCGAKEFSLSKIYAAMNLGVMSDNLPFYILVACSLFLVLLSENCRVPVDDPNTHLELTMIHEVMVLDNSGPDLAFILYGASLKLWLFAALLAGLIMPFDTGFVLLDAMIFLAGVFLTVVAVGVVESVIARLRLLRVPLILLAASALSIISIILILRF